MLFRSVSQSRYALPLIVAGMIPFYFGLSEDITKRVSVAKRLLATMVGALAAILLTNSYLNRLDIPGIDQLVAWWPVGVVLTMVAVSGVTNAVNILDGFNGLASGTVVVILSFFAAMAYQVQDVQLFALSLVLVGSVVGFMLLNYPLGKIFLGVLMAVLLLEENLKTLALPLIVAGMIPFYFGLSEDITKRVS